MTTLGTGAFGFIGAWDGIRKTLDEFAALKTAGRLDGGELEPAK